MFKGSPGGDDYHDVWINPRMPAHDHRQRSGRGGHASTAARHGAAGTTSPPASSITSRADNRFPYWVYSGQQDSGTVGIASRSDYGSVTFRDWHPVGGDERDYDIPDPGDPNIVYGSGLGGRCRAGTRRTGAGAERLAVAGVQLRPAADAIQIPLHLDHADRASAPRPPYPLYMGAQVLFRSTDQGQHWEVISPELNGKTADAKNCDGIRRWCRRTIAATA